METSETVKYSESWRIGEVILSPFFCKFIFPSQPQIFSTINLQIHNDVISTSKSQSLFSHFNCSVCLLRSCKTVVPALQVFFKNPVWLNKFLSDLIQKYAFGLKPWLFLAPTSSNEYARLEVIHPLSSF